MTEEEIKAHAAVLGAKALLSVSFGDVVDLMQETFDVVGVDDVATILAAVHAAGAEFAKAVSD